jgi:hypothetical protein
MDSPQPPAPSGGTPPDTDALVAQWTELLHEMQALNAQLEYLRLLLRLGVRPF